LDAGLGQKKRKGSEDEDIYQNNSTFCELVNKAGLTLTQGKKPNSLGNSFKNI